MYDIRKHPDYKFETHMLQLMALQFQVLRALLEDRHGLIHGEEINRNTLIEAVNHALENLHGTL